MYFTSGGDRAFEQLMQQRPGADHFDSGDAGAPEDCGDCRFYIVIFKTKQADNLEQAFKEFTAKKLSREERPSIRKTLSALKQKAAAKTQGLSL